MKKISLILILCGIAATLIACGVSYKHTQTIEEMSQPYTCAGLHMKQAQWRFLDDFGQQVNVTGSCKKGMKHGNFEFIVNGNLIAKTKYSHDVETKTTCVVMGKTRTNLNNCMQMNAAQYKNNNQQMQQPPMQQTPVQQAPMMQDDQDF